MPIIEEREDLGWIAAHLGETIPYETAFISANAPTAKDFERAGWVMAECSELLDSLCTEDVE